MINSLRSWFFTLIILSLAVVIALISVFKTQFSHANTKYSNEYSQCEWVTIGKRIDICEFYIDTEKYNKHNGQRSSYYKKTKCIVVRGNNNANIGGVGASITCNWNDNSLEEK